MKWLKAHLRRRRYNKKDGLASTNSDEPRPRTATYSGSHEDYTNRGSLTTDQNHSKFSPSLPTISSESDSGVSHDCRKDMPRDIDTEIPLKTDIQPRNAPTAPILGKARNQLPEDEKNRKFSDILMSEKNNTLAHGRSNCFLKGQIADISNVEDIDEARSCSQAVTHETVRPYVHEIKEKQIHREIHNHEVYHRVQPVYDVEVLPARHFVPGSTGALVEVSEDDLPECTGSNQKWHIGETPPPVVSSSMDQQHCTVKRKG